MSEKRVPENNREARKLGILGGSFDPVHNGHLALAREVKNRFGLDRVVFLPAYHSPHKLDQEVASAGHRLCMLQLALAGSPGFEICEVEIARRGPSYSIDTLDEMRALHPAADFYLIMGVDTFMAIHTWKEAPRLLASCNLLVSTRAGHPLPAPRSLVAHLSKEGEAAPYALPPAEKDGEWTFRHRESGKRLTFFPIPPVDVSSRQIRSLIRAGSPARNMLPPEVEHYIIENRLYRTGSPPQTGWMSVPINELQRLIVHAAADKQAFDILILDLRNRSDLTDSFIICSGKSRVHVQAIVDSILEAAAKSPHKVYAIEGYSSGHWVVVDLADVVVHVFYEETRRQYDLERLWGDVPVIDAVGV